MTSSPILLFMQLFILCTSVFMRLLSCCTGYILLVNQELTFLAMHAILNCITQYLCLLMVASSLLPLLVPSSAIYILTCSYSRYTGLLLMPFFILLLILCLLLCVLPHRDSACAHNDLHSYNHYCAMHRSGKTKDNLNRRVATHS